MMNNYIRFRFSFHLYIYPPESQESDRGIIHRASNFPNFFLEMPGYCCPVDKKMSEV